MRRRRGLGCSVGVILRGHHSALGFAWVIVAHEHEEFVGIDAI